MPDSGSQSGADQLYRPRRAMRTRMLDGRRGRMGLCQWGPDSDATILLLHGWMDSGSAWQLLVDCLPEDWSCVALDWPGYGQSAPRAGGYWFPDYLADLEAVLEQLSPQRPMRVIGHSLGGTIASVYAGLRPERLRWLVNIEGFGLPRLAPEEMPGRMLEWLDSVRSVAAQKRYASLAELSASLRARNPHMPAAHARFLVECWTRPVAAGYEMRADEAHRQRSPIRWTREEMEACWARIRAPLLLLHAGASGYLLRVGGADALQRWRELVPGVREAQVGSAGHMLHHEQPAQTARHIGQFVAGLR